MYDCDNVHIVAGHSNFSTNRTTNTQRLKVNNAIRKLENVA